MGISTEILVCEDMTSCTDLAHCHVVDQIATLATVLPSNSYYTVVASIFFVSASCKAIYRVASVRTSDYSQPFWLKWHTLLMPHVLIKYAHVLICICVGEGSQHLSAISLIPVNI